MSKTEVHQVLVGCCDDDRMMMMVTGTISSFVTQNLLRQRSNAMEVGRYCICIYKTT